MYTFTKADEIKFMACYLVTGGCGFIGSHLVDRLIELGHRVIVLDDLSSGNLKNLSNNAELIQGTILDTPLLNSIFQQVDGCFHLAARLGLDESKEHWQETNRINLSGTIGIFEAALKASTDKPKPVLYASSCSVYGESLELPCRESSSIKPVSAYGADKLSCELHAQVAWHVHKIPNIGLRLFNVCGPRQSTTTASAGVIAIYVDRIKNGQPILVYGDGNQTRDFIFVKDVVQAFVYFMGKLEQGAEIYNICTGRAVSLNKLIEMLAINMHCNIEKIYAPKREGDPLESCGDNTKAKKAGFIARYSLEDMLPIILNSF